MEDAGTAAAVAGASADGGSDDATERAALLDAIVDGAVRGENRRLETQVHYMQGRYGSDSINDAPAAARGATPLHFAAAAGNVKACLLLIEAGAAVEPVAAGGGAPSHLVERLGSLKGTPLHCAAEMGHHDVLVLLMRSGALARTPDGEGILPHDRADDAHQARLLRAHADMESSVGISSAAAGDGAGGAGTAAGAAAGGAGGAAATAPAADLATPAVPVPEGWGAPGLDGTPQYTVTRTDGAPGSAAPGGGAGGAGGGGAGGEVAPSVDIQVASDLHLEFYCWPPPRGSDIGGRGQDYSGDAAVRGEEAMPPFTDIVRPKAPVLALLGDIGNPAQPSYAAFLRAMADLFELVLVVEGNHEFYCLPDPDTGRAARESYADMSARVAAACASHPRLVHLRQGSVTVNGVRVLGTTLWSGVPRVDRPTVQASMNDYHLIWKHAPSEAGAGEGGGSGDAAATSGALAPGPATGRGTLTRADGGTAGAPRFVNITADDTNAWHEGELAWLTHQLRTSMARREPACVVLTHHMPTFVGTSSSNYGPPLSNPMAHAFATNLEHLFRQYGVEGGAGGGAGGGGGKGKKGKRGTGGAAAAAAGAAGWPGLNHNSNVHSWAFGHSHFNSDQVIHGTRLVCNQRGYVGHLSAGPPYDAQLVMRIDPSRARTGAAIAAAAAAASAARSKGSV